MRHAKTVGTAALLAAALCLGAATARAAVALRFTPEDTSVALGAPATLRVLLDEPLDVRTVELWVTYDPAVLTSVGGGQGQLFRATGCLVWEGFEPQAPGQWHGYAIVIGSTCWVSGAGELFRWEFTGEARGVSPVVAAEVRLYDPQAVLIDGVTLAPATVRVKDPSLSGVPSHPGGPALRIAPNPFNPRAMVGLAAGIPGPARVELFDLRGRSLGTVWEGWADDAGVSFAWDGRDRAGQALPGGVYLLRLRDAAGSAALARAVILK